LAREKLNWKFGFIDKKWEVIIPFTLEKVLLIFTVMSILIFRTV